MGRFNTRGVIHYLGSYQYPHGEISSPCICTRTNTPRALDVVMLGLYPYSLEETQC